MRKIILFIFFCSVFSKSYGQFNPPYCDSTGIRFDTTGYFQYLSATDYTQKQDTVHDPIEFLGNILQHLNMTRVPTNALYDKVLNHANLLAYRDTALEKPMSNSVHFMQSYYEYYHSLTNITKEIHPDTLANLLDTSYNDSTHAFMLLKATFATIKPDAIDSGWLTLDTNYQLHDGDTTGMPYMLHNIAVAGISASDIFLSQGNHYIKLDTISLLGNDTASIDTIFFQFSNESLDGYFPLRGVPRTQFHETQPIPFEINVNDSLVTISARVKYIDSREVIIDFKVINEKKKTAGNDWITLGGCNGADSFTITGPSLPPSIIADYSGLGGDAPNGEAAKARYYIFWSDNNCSTRKSSQRLRPIIFLDGYDPGDTRRVEQIYSDYINKPIVYGSTSVLLAEKLRADGYDIIVVDYLADAGAGGGGDYIERNGMLLSSVIQDIYSNDSLPSSVDDNVVIGPSYGALVAQYGLAWMEANSIPHHTRTYISFDGPHQGANVPLGVQALAKYIDNGSYYPVIRDEIDKFIDGSIEKAGAKQILMHHINSGSESSPAPDAFRSVFLSHLSAVGGWPHNCRRVAISNGTRNGLFNARITPSQQLIKIERHTYITFGLYKSVDWNVYATGIIRNKVIHNWTAGLVASIASGLPLGWTNSYHEPGPLMQSLDICPGSYFNGIPEIRIKDIPTIFLLYFSGISATYSPTNDVTFIPSVSSFDALPTSPIFNLYNSFNNKVISNSVGNSSFDWVYAKKVSTDHVAVEDTIGAWFVNEIEEVPQDLGTYENYISGSNVCLGGFANFSPTIPTSGYITWSSSPNLTIISGQGTPTVTVQCTAISSDTWIYCNAHPVRGNSSSTLTLKKKLTVTTPPAGSVPPFFNTRTVLYMGSYVLNFYTFLSPPIPANSYSWNIGLTWPTVPLSTITSTANPTMLPLISPAIVPVTVSGYTLTVTNPCGSFATSGGAFKSTSGNKFCVELTVTEDSSGIQDSLALVAIADILMNSMQYLDIDSLTNEDSVCNFLRRVLDTLTMPGGDKINFPYIRGGEPIMRQKNSIVYPNPALNEITILFGGDVTLNEPTEIKLLDMSGRVLVQKTIVITETKHKMKLDNLPAGIYMLETRHGEKRERFKFTKK